MKFQEAFKPQLQAPAKALNSSKSSIKVQLIVFIFLLVACGLWLELNYYLDNA